MNAMPKDLWSYGTGAFEAEDILLNGSRFLISNGCLGYRGTLEEFGAAERTACIVNGVYDQNGDKAREPVNMPNGLQVRVTAGGVPLSCLTTPLRKHRQEIDLRAAVHRRATTFVIGDAEVLVEAERFASQDRPNLLCLQFFLTASEPLDIVVQTGIDPVVSDINGPHFSGHGFRTPDAQSLIWTGRTLEKGIALACGESLDASGLPGGAEVCPGDGTREFHFRAEAGARYRLDKFVAIFTSLDGHPDGPEAAAEALAREARVRGYEEMRGNHARRWAGIWDCSDVEITGDEEAQLALRYSLYQLHSAEPRHSSRVSIPARALSGQVYRGAVFWDTEMFMTPVFDLVDPAAARNLLLYRFHTLEGARRKAASYGLRGAFYAWEGQESGDDACGIFNIADVLTGRPLRTFFRDKQIHVSAAVAVALRDYLRWTGDTTVCKEGGAEVLVECARFYRSRACFKPDLGRYELWDVVGPDEYHERVHNNAYTNRVVAETLDIAIRTLQTLAEDDPAFYRDLEERLQFAAEVAGWRDMRDGLFQQEPDAASGLIPQFDGFFDLEDITPAQLRKRALHPNEYFGGGQGIATVTQVIKQADVVLMLSLLRDKFPAELLEKNWSYYVARTEHGSTLSASSYGIVAARLGRTDEAYGYFLKTASVDMDGNSKQFVGKEYIGGTHPAANGGAYLVAVFGFGGLSTDGNTLRLSPHLPAHWESLSFPLRFRERGLWVKIERDHMSVVAHPQNADGVAIEHRGDEKVCLPGESVSWLYPAGEQHGGDAEPDYTAALAAE